MPVKKIPVIHKFGILTEAHREVLTHRRDSCCGSPINDNAVANGVSYRIKIEEIVRQLEAETTETRLISLEDEAIKSLRRIKFQLSFLDVKNGLDKIKECWDNLCLFSSCRRRKLREFALRLLHSSLCTAPLSKSLLPTILNVASSSIKIFLEKDFPNTWDATYISLSEVIFIACLKLYYHYLLQNLTELLEEKLKQLHLLNKAFFKALTYHRGNPLLLGTLVTINHIIGIICGESDFKESIENTDIGAKLLEDKFQLDVELSSGVLISYADENENVDGRISELVSKTSDTVSLKNSPISTAKERPPIASFLWNSLKLWNCISRQKKITQRWIDRIYLSDFSIDMKDVQWLDYVLGFHTLCECSKLDINNLRILMKLRPKISPQSKSISTRTNGKREILRDDLNWSLELLICYLKCISDISMRGMTTATQKLALLGDVECYGLIDYLFYRPDDPHGWKVRAAAYQLVAQVYVFHESNPMKDGLKNIAWDNMARFRAHEDDELVLNVVKNYDIKQTSVSHENIFAKIATNLCIMAFSSNQCTHLKSSTASAKVPLITQDTKCTTGNEKFTGNFKNDSQKIRFESKLREDKVWPELQQIVEDQFNKELDEDEREKEILRKQMLIESGNGEGEDSSI